MQVIITKYLGYSNSRGSRIMARTSYGKKTRYFAYDHNLTASGNHKIAAMMLASELNWSGTYTAGDLSESEFVWVRTSNASSGYGFKIQEREQ